MDESEQDMEELEPERPNCEMDTLGRSHCAYENGFCILENNDLVTFSPASRIAGGLIRHRDENEYGPKQDELYFVPSNRPMYGWPTFGKYASLEKLVNWNYLM